jgi:glutamate formiminotransferase
MPWVECVPNFSEGQRPDVVDAIRAAVASVEGAHVLDASSDPDHHRSVITFIAPPDRVGEAAFRAVRAASRLIDLDQHQGQHPRIGAADVVPFIPLRGVTMATCVQIARELGDRVARELDLPVYLYEEAALRPERRNLAYVRRDRYEVLKTTIAANPDRAPDFGPSRLGKAGAVAIGARGPLIALNAYLDTADVQIAVEIARAIRESGGGLPHLKALGLLVDGLAQVSMNVVDYRRTSLFVIMERLRAEANRHGVAVVGAELIGLIPQGALIDAALSYLQLPPETRDRLLEQRVGLATGDYAELRFE